MVRGLAAGLLAVLAAGCVVGGDGEPGRPLPQVETPAASRAPTAVSRSGGSLRIGLTGDPTAIDPRFVADWEGELVADAVFDSLVALDPNQQVVAAAADGWEVSDDGLRYTFRLREGARFHDGTPVTAEAFVRSFRRIADGTLQPRSELAEQLAPIAGYRTARRGGRLTGVSAEGPRTLRIRLRQPHATFLRVLSHPGLAPVPEGADSAGFATAPVGNGPFAVAQPWEPGQFIRLRAVDEHARAPLLDEIVLQIYPRGASPQAFEDLREGGLDVAPVPATRREEALRTHGRSDDGYTGPGLLDGSTMTVYLYGFDVTEPPFDDPVLRRAVSLAIDRRAIVRDLLAGSRLAAGGIVPPGVPGVDADPCDVCRRDVQAARALLEREGVEPPAEPVELVHPPGRTHTAIAEAVAGHIREVLGWEVTATVRELGDYVGGDADRGDLFRMGFQPATPSMGAYLDPLFASDGVLNLFGFRSRAVDGLLEQAARTQAPTERTALWREAERHVLDASVVAPLFVYRHELLVAEDVRDFRIGPTGRVNLERVWIDQAG